MSDNKSTDQSHLGKKYFIDENKYNCPFCNMTSVGFEIFDKVQFNETNDKQITAIFVECCHCNKKSMHLTKHSIINYSSHMRYKFYFPEGVDKDIDPKIFLHIPTSFFTIDSRIPRKFRELIEEASICIKNNALTGASACIRKAIYEFLLSEKLKSDEYDDKIKELKKKYPKIDELYFDILSSIKGITSDQVHEDSYENYDNEHAKGFLELLKQLFYQRFVLPSELSEERNRIGELFGKISKEKKEKTAEVKADNNTATK